MVEPPGLTVNATNPNSYQWLFEEVWRRGDHAPSFLPDTAVAIDAGKAHTLPHHCPGPSGGHSQDHRAVRAQRRLPGLRRSWRTCRTQVPVLLALCRVRTRWCLSAPDPAPRHHHGSGSPRSYDWCGSRPCSNRRRARMQLRHIPSALQPLRARSSPYLATVRSLLGFLQILRKILSRFATSASPLPDASRQIRQIFHNRGGAHRSSKFNTPSSIAHVGQWQRRLAQAT